MPDNTHTLYRPGTSRFHRFHPSSKLFYILLTMVAVYLGPAKPATAGVLFCLNLGIAGKSGLFQMFTSAMLRFMLPLAVMMLAIHGLLHPDNRTIVFAIGKVQFFQEGLLFSTVVLLQLAAFLSSSLLFAYTTHPADLIAAISQSGVPPFLAYLLASPLLLLPAIRERANTIQAAQRARGLATQGSLLTRFRALFPMVLPLVLGALIEVEQRAIALEIRSFNVSSRKTSWRILTDSASQHLARRAMAGAVIVIIIHRLLRIHGH